MFLQQIINGLTIGSLYALVAIGFSMVFSVIELTNFANSSLFMLGAYIFLLMDRFIAGNFFFKLTISVVILGVIGFSLDWLA